MLSIQTLPLKANSHLNGWQRITAKPKQKAVTALAQWEEKLHALMASLEALL